MHNPFSLCEFGNTSKWINFEQFAFLFVIKITVLYKKLFFSIGKYRTDKKIWSNLSWITYKYKKPLFVCSTTKNKYILKFSKSTPINEV